jgi:hypothetical protein
MGVHITGVYLTGAHLIGILQEHASWGHVSHGRVPHRHASHRRAPPIGVHLRRASQACISGAGVSIGVYLMSVYLGRIPHGRVPWACTLGMYHGMQAVLLSRTYLWLLVVAGLVSHFSFWC